MAKKFAGSFNALTQMGAQYQNSQRFTPLHGAGKPLWEFKEFDHRLYCHRGITGGAVVIALLNGWVKDKTKGKREDQEIARALSLFSEFLAEFPGGRI